MRACQQLMAKATNLCSLAGRLRGERPCSTIGWLTRVTSPYSRGSGSPLPSCRSQVTTQPAPCGAPKRRRTSCRTSHRTVSTHKEWCLVRRRAPLCRHSTTDASGPSNRAPLARPGLWHPHSSVA